LEYSIGENQKRLQEEKLQSIQAQGDVNLQNQSLIEREKQKTKAQEVDAKIMILRETDKIDEQKTRRDALTKELLAQKQHERELQLKSMEVNIKQNIEGFKEDRKDARVNLQDTNESKKIFQRKNNTAPINFEEELNSIFK